MVGDTSSNGGRDPKVSDEEILNVIRKSANKKLSTTQIREDPSIPIGQEALRQRLKKLENRGRVVSEDGGGLLIWKLGELESRTPVTRAKVAKARRVANFIKSWGKSFRQMTFGFGGAAIILFIGFLHTETGQINPPLLSPQQLATAGFIGAYTAAVLWALSSALYAAAGIIPRIVEWRIAKTEEDPTTN